MNEKLKERIERLAEERDSIQSKIDDVNSELNRLFPLKNDLVDILSKKHECLKGLLEATIRELRYIIASEADGIKMAELDNFEDTNSFGMGGVHFTDVYGLKYVLGLESVHAREIMKERDYGSLIGFVYDRSDYKQPEINGSHLSFDNIQKVGCDVNGMSVSLHRVKGKGYFNIKIEDKEGNYTCIPFARGRTDYSPTKLVLMDEDDRIIWASEIPKLEQKSQ